MPTKLTYSHARKVPSGTRLFDVEPRGFGVRGTPSGNYWVFRFSIGGQRRELTLGRVDAVGIEKARRMARDAAAEKQRGVDPILQRERTIEQGRLERHTRAREAAKPTLAVFAERYMEEHAKPHKKPSSIASDRNILDATILSVIGGIRVADIDIATVKRFHAGLRRTPYRANRALALLSTILAKAEAWGERPLGSNPCPAIDRYPEKARERFLEASEAARLSRILDAASDERRDAADAIRLLLLTGCRKGEIVGLTWQEVDLDGAWLRLRDSKTGRRTVPLGAEAVDVLRRRFKERISNEFVFARNDGSRMVGVDEAWQAFREAAKIQDVRLHDLRHSFAAAGIAAGLTLPEIGKLLGHKAAATTARYAHVCDDVARSAADRVAAVMAETTATGRSRLRRVV